MGLADSSSQGADMRESLTWARAEVTNPSLGALLDAAAILHAASVACASAPLAVWRVLRHAEGHIDDAVAAYFAAGAKDALQGRQGAQGEANDGTVVSGVCELDGAPDCTCTVCADARECAGAAVEPPAVLTDTHRDILNILFPPAIVEGGLPFALPHQGRGFGRPDLEIRPVDAAERRCLVCGWPLAACEARELGRVGGRDSMTRDGLRAQGAINHPIVGPERALYLPQGSAARALVSQMFPEQGLHCRALSQGDVGWICTRVAGHAGAHVAHGKAREALAWWEADEQPAPAATLADLDPRISGLHFEGEV